MHYLASPNKPTAGIDALVDRKHKLIARLNGEAELYDLARDPRELRDVAAERPGVVSRMRGALEEIRRENESRRLRNFAMQTEEERLDSHDRALEGLRELGYIE